MRLGMENLKYSEILQQNKALGEEIKGTPYKVTVLANVTTNSLKEILEYIFRINQINPVIEFGNYDNIVQDSATFAASDLVLVFFDTLNIVSGVSAFFEDLDDEIYNNIKSRICSEIDIILENLKDCPSVIFNTFSSTYFVSGYSQKSKIETLTSELNEYLIDKKRINITLVDIDKIISQIGIKQAIDFRLYHSSKAPYSLSFYRNYVAAIEPIILRNTGKLKKAIIFDCDNTLWKGIVGEDGFNGIEMSRTSHDGYPFNMVQQIAVFLSKRGVIVGICSRNNELDVSEVLMNHPDIVLKEEHIIIKKINWEDKVTNLRSIASELNIDLDSIVFVDDSSFEINLIREQIPEICSLQVPSAIFEYPDYLLKYVYKYFNLSLIGEDAQKTAIYKQQFQRESTRNKYKTINDYLSSLKIAITIFKDERSLISRIAQLTQKTNQFNLTTRRYTENQILKFMENSDDYVFAVSVKDKFGDNGFTAVAIIITDPQNRKNVFIDTFLMSCRIIGRNIEYAFMDYIMQWLTEKHYLTLHTEFIPTKKNGQVNRFYDDLGFILLKEEEGEKQYFINLSNYQMKKIEYIKLETATNTRN
jgi:FkbH-like protein